MNPPGRTCAIMQPTYLPWIGYMAMIDRVDVFVFLDSVAFSDRSWQQRNYVRVGNEKHLLTIPVLKKGRRGQRIDDVKTRPDGAYPTTHIRTIQRAYAKAPFFDAYSEGLFAAMGRGGPRLCETTLDIIHWLMTAFSIDTPTLRSSAMAVDGVKADLLAHICKTVGADRYLSAPGSRAYIEESDAFTQAAIEVEYHEYEHPTYPQTGEGFIPYLGSIDLLFNLGGDEGRSILRSGVTRSHA